MRPTIHKVEAFTLLKVIDSIDARGNASRDTQPISATPKRGARVLNPSATLSINNEYRRYFGDKIFLVAYTPENLMISESISDYAIQYKNEVYRLNKSDEQPDRSGFKFYGIKTPPQTAA